MSRLSWNPEAVRSAIVASCNDGLKAVGVVVQGEMSRILGVRHGGIPSKPGQPPNSQSGRLRNSVLVDQARPLEVRIGTNLFYGAQLEGPGDTRIFAKGKAMTIPLSPEVKRMTERGIRPRSIINAYSFDKSRPLRWIPTRKGTLVVRDYRGRGKGQKGARTEALFLLVRSVTIKARPWMRPAFQRSKPMLLGEFVKSANRSFRQRAKGSTA